MRRIIGGVGRALVTIGILILLFVAYQLWGTGLYEAREQSRLQAQFAKELAHEKAVARRNATATTTTTIPQSPPASGEPIGIIQIPKIGLERAIIQGIGVPDLRKAPGHYPATPLPGQLGNAAIAGHRTTYGAPFNRLDELGAGDPIIITTLAGKFHYTVTTQQVVSPTEVFVLDPTPNATLTLTTCNPKFSASQRLVVKAVLDKAKSPKPQKAPPLAVANRASLDDALSGRGEPRLPTLWFGLIAAAVGGLWWLVFHRYHRWTTWFMGVIPFTVVLFIFYYHLERLLPANY
ncbi:MAG: class E sortase [Acidimicrobiia bacterium]